MNTFKTYLLYIAATTLLLVNSSTFAEAVLLDRVVAVVNQDVVTLREYQAEIDTIRSKIAAQGAGMPPEQLIEKQALRRAILLKLQLNEAKKLGMEVDDAMLTTAINNIAERNQLTLEEMQQMMAEEGVDFAVYREQLRQKIILSRLHQREVVDRIQISEAQIDNYLTKADAKPGGKTAVQLSHILLATPESASSDTIEAQGRRAQQLKDQLDAGGDFRSAAINNSDGRQALEGGDLGWLEIDSAPSIFLDVLTNMERGDIAGPIQSSSGFHIIKLEDYRGEERSIVDQNHVRHILIRTNELTSDNDARTRLEQLRSRILAGDDFAALARSNSDDKTSAIKGGDLGWVSPGDLVPKFEDTMNAMKINELSEPFRTQFGWHIIQVLERRTHDVTAVAQREEIRKILRQQRSDEALELYLRKLLDQAYIEEYLDKY